MTWHRSSRGRSAVAIAGLVALLALRLAAAAEPQPGTERGSGCNPAEFLVLLDVGHTLESPGTKSARGVPEYAFNLRLATRVRQTLLDGGFARTELLITHGTGRAQLFERAARASARKPDLVLSIHHDDVQDRYHAKWTYQGRRLLYSDRFAGYSLFVSQASPRFAQSLAFATLLGSELKAHGLAFTSHHAEDIPGERRAVLDPEHGVFRYDALIVLAKTDAPTVLMEAGVIVNRAEELALASSPRQDAIAAAVHAAVEKFCASGRQH
jgi:N-acetylmuramoyl-L-alanine amidase